MTAGEDQIDLNLRIDALAVRSNQVIVKITPNLQVTLPPEVLDAMGVGPGDRLEITEHEDGFLLKPKRIDNSKLGVLKDLIDPNTLPFDIRKFREGTYDWSLRD